MSNKKGRKIKYSIENCHKLAKSKNGECLSQEYNGYNVNHIWKCLNCENIWEARFSNIKNGSWCPFCNDVKYSQEEVEKIISDKGGILLSEYKNGATKIKIRCALGHEFEKQLNTILAQNGWCNICASSKSERIVREHFEQLFKNKFPMVRPSWLRSDISGRSLELDGYCEELNLAFEHQGMQHYENVLQKSDEKFERTKYNDNLKVEITKKLGINLIIIPALSYKLQPKDLKNFIKNECIKLNIELPEDYDNIVVNYDIAYINANMSVKSEYIP
jgi:hypothetical protein